MNWESVPQMALSAADRFGDAEAVVDGPLRLTFRQLADRVRTAAGAFAAAGIDKGDRAAIWAPNSAEWIIAALGLLTAGGTVVPVNTRFRGEEAADVIRRSGAKFVLVQKDFLGLDYSAPVDVPTIDLRSGFLDGDLSPSLGGRSLKEGTPLEREVASDDICDIIFTSGTTGRPKGVLMTHGQNLRSYTEWCDLADLREGDRYLMVNPFFHTFGLKAGIIACLIRGATMLPVPVFDVDRVLDLVEQEKVAMLPGPPTLYHSLLEASRDRDLSSLRAAVTGSADIPVELIRRMKKELPFQSIMTGYGLTEAGTVTASRPGDTFEQIATTVGTPCEGMEVRIADDGEVLTRGYNVMRGYLDDPAATAEAIDADGWLHTGDLGLLDNDGHLKITGRKKDMFIVGGFNAYPAEIEGFLLEHPAVAQVAVIGVPDERMGQVGKAFVVARNKVSAEDLIAWSKGRMAGYKVPRQVEFLQELPLNATGKVDKAQLT